MACVHKKQPKTRPYIRLTWYEKDRWNVWNFYRSDAEALFDEMVRLHRKRIDYSLKVKREEV